MNLMYAIASLLTFLICSAVGVFVYAKGRRLSANRFYSLLSFSTALWSAGIFMHAVVTEPARCLFWGRFAHIGASFIPIFYLLFILKLVEPKIQIKVLTAMAVIMAVTFSIFAFHKNFFTSVSPKVNLTQWADPGSAYPLFIFYFLILPIIAFMFLLLKFKGQALAKKNQLSYVIIASLLGFAGGSTTFLTVYGVRILFIHPYGLYFVSAYNLIIAYAIVRHQLMDIEVIIKRTLVFAGLFSFMFGVFAAVVMLISTLIVPFSRPNIYLSSAISIAIILLLHDPFKNFLINITNKFLFQKKYDPRKILKNFEDEALTILHLNRLCKVTIDTLVENLYLLNCAVLLKTTDETGYEIYDSFGIDNKNAYLANECNIIRYFQNTHLPILYQSYDRQLQASDDIKKDMDKIESQLCMPLIIHKEIVGILSLGAKKSDIPYTADDIDILTTLVKALSIAISNARLFMQAAQYEKLATIGTLASAINHEVCNPLNNISVGMQIFMSDIQRGIYNDKSEELLKKVKNMIQDSIEQIHKVASITSKLSSFAKPSKIVESKPVDIAQSIEDALGVLGHKLKLDKIEVERDIPKELPRIIADEDQVQQVFFNLIKNAAESIKEKGTITITAKEDDGKIKIKVADTGCGIPEDKLNKIFEPFYTTKVDGSGYGLSVVREIIWRNKGDIRVESKLGEGTIFYLEFPKA